MTATLPTPTSTRGDAPEARRGRAPWVTVARREIVVRLTDKAFLIGTATTLLLICVFMGFQVYDASRTSSYTVVTTSADAETGRLLAQEAPGVDEKVEVTADVVPDAAAAEAAVTDGDADAWLHRDGGGWELTTLDSEAGGLTRVAQEVVREQALTDQADRLGTSVSVLEAGSSLTPTFLRGDAEESQVSQLVSFAFAFLFYIAALTFGYVIANSVVEEKQSRVVEIIATAVSLRQLLAGKVLGTSAIAVLQMVLYAVVGLVGLSFTDYSAFVPAVTGPVAWYLVFFVAGFVTLATLWAVAGALASRAEDVQSTGTPLLMLVLGVFFGSFLLDGTARTVASFVPPFSAVLMPARMLDGSASWWQAVVALVLLLAVAAVVVRFAERLYRRSLLQTGGKLSIRQAWSAPE